MVLRRGVSIPAAAYVVALNLAARGVSVHWAGEDILVCPGHRLTDENGDRHRLPRAAFEANRWSPRHPV